MDSERFCDFLLTDHDKLYATEMKKGQREDRYQ